ncbi:MAG: pilus assembly protein TadG-related protein [Planctomycetota bacterium]|nr:pilus assembly protein TadG-related protein [Planctomycetota bacterium]
MLINIKKTAMFLRTVGRRHRRSGAIAVLTALLLISLLGFAALGIDVGYMLVAKRQLQRSADAAAHAAALNISNPTVARPAARDAIGFNPVLGQSLQLPDADIIFGTRNWNTSGYYFTWGTLPYNAVKVTARKTQDSPNGSLPLILAPLLGKSRADFSASSIAVVYPRDIVFILDVSGSMHHDGEMWAIPLLNWQSPNVQDGKGAGTLIQEAEWADFGLTAGGVPLDLADNPTAQNTFNFLDHTKNQEIVLPLLVNQSLAQSVSTYNGVDTNKTAYVTSNNTIQAKLDYADILAYCNSTTLKSSTANGRWPSDFRTAYSTSSTHAAEVCAYDFIVDQYLPKVMPLAKPSLTDVTTRNTYRTYWRGYTAYVTGNAASSNSADDGIDGGNNPSSSYWGVQKETEYKDLYRRSDGSQYPYSLQTEMAELKNHANYASYIQFMMDQANERQSGIQNNGNSATGSQLYYSPKQMNKWLSQAGSAGDTANVYRLRSADYSTDLNPVYLPPREFPASAVLDAVLACCKKLNQDSQGVNAVVRDNVAVVAFSDTFYQISGTSTDPFLDVVDDYSALLAAVVAGGQSRDNGTNTMSALRVAEDWFGNHGRASASRVVILFTDGEANQSTSPKSLATPTPPLIDLNSEGIKNDPFYLSGNALYTAEKNAALREVLDLFALNVTVNAITAGAGNDDFVQRMSLLTNGIFQDSGAAYDQYASNLTRDFERLAKVRAISFAIEH